MPSESWVPLTQANPRRGLGGERGVCGVPVERVTTADRWLLRTFLRAVGNPNIRVALWDGWSTAGSDSEPLDTVQIHDRRTLLRFVFDPELQFGEAYTDGRLTVEGDLVRLLRTVFEAPASPLAARLLSRGHRPHRNSLRGSRDNIHSHYDLGNDFYRLWLDERMIYTCAYFPTTEASLEEAQVAKLEHVCRKLALAPGERVVEAGCGWGALALHMARHHGVSVRAFNISHEQIAYARERAQREGLADRIEFVEDDYRNVSGRYDAFVSIGMLEHVGRDHHRDLGATIDRCLPPHGRGLLHSLGRNQAQPFNAWMERYIFPGAYIPSLREMVEILEPHRMSVLDVENLRLHYAKTTSIWLERFEQVTARVAAMFDERFVRAWRLYLASSTAAFLSGSIQLFQVLFARAQHNDMPWTRAHLYR